MSTSSKLSHPWSSESLFTKAMRYAGEMQTYSREDWRFGLYSSFVLEFLARAALSAVSPALLADAKEWNNLYFALGHSPKATRFIAKSIDTASVLSRLRDVLPEFTSEQEGFVAQHINRRNEELHTGSVPFDGLPTAWLGAFYQTSQVLLKATSRNLSDLFGEEEAAFAEQLIAASLDESAKAVQKAISAHKLVWEAKAHEDKEKALSQATAWATRMLGHRVSCPACLNDALVAGDPISAPVRRLNGDLIVEVQDHLPSKFECIACQLKIAGLSQLTAAGLGSTYKSTSTFEAADYYAPEDTYQDFEDDNNEY